MIKEEVHRHHCYQGEFEVSCKYGEVDCPAKPNNTCPTQVDLKPGMSFHFATAKDYREWLSLADIDFSKISVESNISDTFVVDVFIKEPKSQSICSTTDSRLLKKLMDEAEAVYDSIIELGHVVDKLADTALGLYVNAKRSYQKDIENGG